jgi:hypothetical protein
LGLVSVSAQAQGSWVVSAVSYGSNTTTGSTDLGTGGFCYNTHNTTSPYWIISTILVNNPEVGGTASFSASQEIDWSGSTPSTTVDVYLAATAQGVYESGANEDSRCSAGASASCDIYSVPASGSTTYPTPFNSSPDSQIHTLNTSGTATSFEWTTATNAAAFNTGSYSYGQAWAYFTPSSGGSGGGGG